MPVRTNFDQAVENVAAGQADHFDFPASGLTTSMRAPAERSRLADDDYLVTF